MFRATLRARTLLSRPATLLARPTLVAVSARALASKAGGALAKAPKEPEGLAGFLAREIAFEKEDESAAASLVELRGALAADWTVTDVAGVARFALAKKHGAQAVRVDVDITPMPSDEDYPEGEDEDAEPEAEPEPPADGYRMIVTVDGAKGKAMQFGCFVTNELRIHRVTVHDTAKTPSAEAIFAGGETADYAGPNFEELDQALQNAFYEYLADRCVV
jgi:hypothetical protein